MGSQCINGKGETYRRMLWPRFLSRSSLPPHLGKKISCLMNEPSIVGFQGVDGSLMKGWHDSKSLEIRYNTVLY